VPENREAKTEIRLIWIGRCDAPVKTAIESYQAGKVENLVEVFAFDEVPDSLSKYNSMFVNLPVATIAEFFRAHLEAIADENLAVIIPAPLYPHLDHSTSSRLSVKPFLYFFPVDALDSLPAFIEQQIVVAGRGSVPGL